MRLISTSFNAKAALKNFSRPSYTTTLRSFIFFLLKKIAKGRPLTLKSYIYIKSDVFACLNWQYFTDNFLVTIPSLEKTSMLDIYLSDIFCIFAKKITRRIKFPLVIFFFCAYFIYRSINLSI